MKIWKLVSGIVSIVLSVFVVFQSGIAGLSNALEENGESGGSAGLFLAILMLTGGIISIVVHNKNGKGANIALIVIFGLAALLGFALAGSYSDLRIWAGWCLINAVFALVSMFLKKKEPKKVPETVKPVNDVNVTEAGNSDD